MIIGLTAYARAGKDTVADYLIEKHGYKKYVFSNILGILLKGIDLEVTKENMSRIGVALREASTQNILAIMLSQKLKGQDNIVITGFRSPGEVNLFRDTFEDQFKLIYVERDFAHRFKSRTTIDQTEEDFQKRDIRDGQKMGLDNIISEKMYDIKIINETSVERLNFETEKFMERFKNKKISKRLSWDDYFMKLTMLTAERSTCQRHHVGAIIAKNKQLLTTGYNGAAANTKDCLELGCLRNELNIPSGTRHEVCRAIHAEQNAIIQAGLHGIDISGGTLYCTHSPCIICAKMIVNAGIKKVITYTTYPDNTFEKLFREAGVEFIKIKKPSKTINVLE